MAESDAKVTRRNDVVPGDGQDEPADGSTSTITWSDPNKVNYADALQHALLRMGEDLGRVGPLSERPSAGSDEPVWWLVTGEPASPYWTYNDGSSWVLMDQFADGVEVGADAQDTIVASGPVSFSGSADRDLHIQTDLTIQNTTGSSATEDVTVTLYDGVDANGTQLLTETTSVSVNATSSTTETFIATEQQLDTGDYYLDITYSGSTLETATDGVAEQTRGATYAWDEDADGTGRLRDTRRGVTILTVDPIDGTIDLQNNATNVTNGVASGTATLSSGTAVVDTGYQTDTTAFYDVQLNPDGCDIAASLDSTGSTYEIHLEENTSSVGNPDVKWRLVRSP